MELMFFGLSSKDLIFSILLPLILFYLTLYVFLKKSKIFGEVSNYYYAVTSMLVSLISIFSIYSLGLSWLLPLILTFFIVVVFFVVYFLSIYKHSERVIKKLSYNLETLIKEIENLTKDYEKAPEAEKEKIKEKLREKISLAKDLGKAQGRNVENESWFIKAKKIVE